MSMFGELPARNYHRTAPKRTTYTLIFDGETWPLERRQARRMLRDFRNVHGPKLRGARVMLHAEKRGVAIVINRVSP